MRWTGRYLRCSGMEVVQLQGVLGLGLMAVPSAAAKLRGTVHGQEHGLGTLQALMQGVEHVTELLRRARDFAGILDGSCETPRTGRRKTVASSSEGCRAWNSARALSWMDVSDLDDERHLPRPPLPRRGKALDVEEGLLGSGMPGPVIALRDQEPSSRDCW